MSLKNTNWNTKATRTFSKSSVGFSLIELLFVVTTFSVLAAIAIPNLVASRRAANQASAIATLRIYHSAQMSFQLGQRFLADFQLLKMQTNDAIDNNLGYAPNNVIKSGYVFTIGPGILPNSNPSLTTSTVFNGIATYPAFYIQANPLNRNGLSATGRNGYYIDYSGTIRVRIGGSDATSLSDPLGIQGAF